MKAIAIVGLGVMIWAATLLAPQVNLFLTPPVMLALVGGLTAVLSLSLVLGRLGERAAVRSCPDGDCRPGGYDGCTRPVAPLPMPR
jgi:hypothetical protein